MPTQLLLKGPMGIGKSATAKILGQHLGWCVLDKDDASDVLLGKLEPHGKYAYEIMFSYSESLLQQGFSVIVDSPSRSELGYLRAASFAAEHSIDLRVLELFCSDETEWARRLETRTRRPAHIIKNWQDFEAYWEKAEKDFDYVVTHSYLKVDTLKPLNENLVLITDWLKNETPDA